MRWLHQEMNDQMGSVISPLAVVRTQFAEELEGVLPLELRRLLNSIDELSRGKLGRGTRGHSRGREPEDIRGKASRMTELRYAVVGAGALGRHHARIAAGLPGVRLVAVADPHEAQGRSVAEACGCPWIADYRDLPDEVNAASVAVPTSLHRQVASDLLKRDIALLIEKPLAGNVPDGEALVQLAEQRGCLLQVGHIERFNPAFREASRAPVRPGTSGPSD